MTLSSHEFLTKIIQIWHNFSVFQTELYTNQNITIFKCPLQCKRKINANYFLILSLKSPVYKTTVVLKMNSKVLKKIYQDNFNQLYFNIMCLIMYT